MTSGRQIIWFLSCVWVIASCTAKPAEHIETQHTPTTEENNSSLSVVSSSETESVELQLEEPVPANDRNTFDPNLLIIEILKFAECEQNIELMSDVAAEVVLRGSRTQGLALFEKIKALKPDNLLYVQPIIGVDLARAGEIEQALSISQELITQGMGTDSVPTLLEVAYQVNEHGQTDWADTLLAETLEAADDNSEYVVGHSVSIDELEDVRTDIAEAYVRIGRIDEALELVKSISNGGDIYGYITAENRSQVYSQLLPLLEDIQRVYAVYEHEKTRLRLNKGDGFNTLSDIAIRLFQLGDEVVPLQILEILESEKEPNEISLLLQNGAARNRILSEISIHLATTGRHQEAIEIASQISEEPDGPENSFTASDFYIYKALAWIQLANEFNRTGAPEKASQFFEKAFLLMQTPSNVIDQNKVAVAFVETGQIQTAMRYLKESQPMRPGVEPNTAARKTLISSLIKLNQFNEAAELVNWLGTNNSRQPVANCRMNRVSKQQIESLLTILVNMPDEFKMDLDISEWLSSASQ